MKQETLNKLNLCEDHERECKLANGGLPESIWETYSSFANTNGGTILLGIREHGDSFTIEGLTDKQIIKYQKDFWSTLNDRNKISKNILLNHHVQVVEVEDKKILKIDIPAADRHVELTETDEINNMNKEQKVLYYLKSHDSISTQQTMELCEYKTRAGARRLLERMIQNDVLRKIGSGPGTKYIFNDDK